MSRIADIIATARECPADLTDDEYELALPYFMANHERIEAEARAKGRGECDCILCRKLETEAWLRAAGRRQAAVRRRAFALAVHLPGEPEDSGLEL